MIRNQDSISKFAFSFFVALVLHVVIFALVKNDSNNFEFLSRLSQSTKNLKRPIKLDKIDFVKQSVVEKLRKVGIKDGLKNLEQPDLAVKRPSPKGTPGPTLSLEKLAPQLPKHEAIKEATPKTPNLMAKKFLNKTPSLNETGGHFYYSPKDQKVIPHSDEQENLKMQAIQNINAPTNKATERITNFEIRYERPEGVSEDELNSDEKAYYSFYVRSYQNYFSKIYSNYERIVINRPGLANVFDKKHLLIGKIDYDENGNIITVRILKSSENDDLHYFFEETLKQLNQPNPPKVFTKNRKEFSIYYQLQIN